MISPTPCCPRTNCVEGLQLLSARLLPIIGDKRHDLWRGVYIGARGPGNVDGTGTRPNLIKTFRAQGSRQTRLRLDRQLLLYLVAACLRSAAFGSNITTQGFCSDHALPIRILAGKITC